MVASSRWTGVAAGDRRLRPSSRGSDRRQPDRRARPSARPRSRPRRAPGRSRRRAAAATARARPPRCARGALADAVAPVELAQRGLARPAEQQRHAESEQLAAGARAARDCAAGVLPKPMPGSSAMRSGAMPAAPAPRSRSRRKAPAPRRRRRRRSAAPPASSCGSPCMCIRQTPTHGVRGGDGSARPAPAARGRR